MKKWVWLLLVMAPLLSFAQDSSFGNWINYFGTKKLSDRFNFHHEIQYRNYNAVGDLEQLLLRTGVGYNLTEGNNNLLLGYGFIHSQNYVPGELEKNEVDEHRIFQQFITTQKINRVNVQHRYRFEQRFIEGDFKLRYRYFLSLNVPLNNSELLAKTIYLSAYNEIFLNDRNGVFDRNRLYGGLGYKFSDAIRLELAYMNQFLRGKSRDQLNINTFVSF
ncbi:DUF2490 domain-containing protein [Marinoscillum sp. MHG1-6]|uniref:DUF2490 domain-containing protein n=1 Tax=Marinoscillum sp. MHG1-6 TaxID=2959627 RepID=UPI002157F7BB|nr:DUF2490 domain-containing protein [Marinoscillum sp. MHG1-6]